MLNPLLSIIETELHTIREAGLWKEERAIESPQRNAIRVGGREVVNFCANNYLGLADHPQLLAAGERALREWGYGMASVRFICGTQTQHQQLEQRISAFLRMDDAILYSSCFDANGGLFETLLGEADAIVSDALNHASIIDGIRLCKAQRFRYAHADLNDLEAQLRAARTAGARAILVATDGVFSMDGDIAKLAEICAVAERFEAAVMVDDSHATGFFGPGGRGTPAFCGVEGRVDILTSTLGKALGGATGGFTTSRRPVIDLLRNRSRPYLFSNSLAPVVTAVSLAVLELLTGADTLRLQLHENTRRFRTAMTDAGFQIRPGEHPIVPIMLGEAKLAVDVARDLLAEGIYVIGFSYPVVPKGAARIRVQLSAAHTPAQVDQAIAAFTKVGKRHGVI
ncbi:MAG: glycine C-acetyltransferase [Deltaproteobacteria bacterium]|nr:glycine C-acetyltransferase [Deltaproteobacteria bacterium]